MASRLNLHEELCEILGTRNVYYSPPTSVKMNYPAIKYSRSGIDTKRANGKIYASTNRYEVIYIDKNPDSSIPDTILQHFPMCSYEREYPTDNLNHTVLTLYY